MRRYETNKKRIVSWKLLSRWLFKVRMQMANSGKHFDGIYGISRGGLVPAVMLSHATGIQMFSDPYNITTNTLIVDDISDSGKTLRGSKVNGNKIAVIVQRYNTKTKADFVGHIAKNTNWYLFPWEEW